MEVKNAIIEDAILDIGDRGLLTGWIYLDYGGSSQGFGGMGLYLPKSFTHHKDPGNFAGCWIFRVLQIAGVDRWDKLKGRTIRAKCGHSQIHAIGHIVKDDWFNPSKEFDEIKELFTK